MRRSPLLVAAKFAVLPASALAFDHTRIDEAEAAQLIEAARSLIDSVE
jgi:hypothetical protein